MITRQRQRRREPRRESGAAILAAMLTVALVATFAAAALWQQWRAIEVEQAERSRVQSAWLLVGALDWARLVLREDAKSGSSDHLAEPWAVPLKEARLSSFLSSDKAARDETGVNAPEAFVSGQITDLQSLLNVNNLVDAGKASESGFRSFARLFELLGLPPAQLSQLAANLRRAGDPNAQLAGAAPLMPQRVGQLVWLGLPVQTIAVLQPYITVLPQRTPVNLNTASAEIIYASVDGLSMADAQRLVAERERSHFNNLNDASKLIPGHERAFQGAQDLSVATRFFEVRTRLRLDQLTVEERSVVQRDGQTVAVLYRDRGAVNPTVPSMVAQRR